MATKTHYFPGICKWAKVHTPDKEYNNYSIEMYLSDDGWNEFEKSGLRLEPKETEDGKCVKFRRDTERKFGSEVVHFGKPGVFIRVPKDEDARGMKETNDLIGNGSSVVCKVSVYDTKKGKGHRLEAVLVDKLVSYTPSPFNYKFNDDVSPNHNVDKSSGRPF